MRGKRLSYTFPLAAAAALSVAAAAFAVTDTTAAGSRGVVDTSAVKTVKVDSIGVDRNRVGGNAAVVDTIKDTVKVDRSSAVNTVRIDTVGIDNNRVDSNTAVVDTAKIDTVKTDGVSVDTSVVNTAAADTTPSSTDPTTVSIDTPSSPTSPPVSTLSPDSLIHIDESRVDIGLTDAPGGTRAPYAVVLTLSLVVIAATFFYFYSKKRDKRRYLTTMRLSVLDRTVQRACRYVEGHFDDPQLTVESVCKALVTGEAYLNTLFVKEVGIDVRDFITQVRVNGIKFFIKEYPDRSIEKICIQCGFETRAAAERPFAGVCGASIEEYARSVR